MILFVILIILVSVVLGLIVLVQNPKGGGLASNIGGMSNQYMGVKQTTDVLEKGTWIFAALIAILCLFSGAFIPQGGSNGVDMLDKLNTRPTTTTTTTAPLPNATAPVTVPDSAPGK